MHPNVLAASFARMTLAPNRVAIRPQVRGEQDL